MFSKATEYAIRALVYIIIQNKQGKRPGFKEIAKEINSPEQFTAKILQILTKKGLLQSLKGRGGGFFFKDASSPLSLYEVIRVMEVTDFFTACGFGLKDCNSSQPCPLHDEYLIIRNILFQLTNKTSIQSLAEKIINREAILSRVQIVDGMME